jgi:signal transduction histidine kinase
MEFTELAALTIHDVKNRLAILAGRAEAKGDAETLHGALEAAATLTRLLVFYKAQKGALGVDIDAHVPAELLAELAAEIARQTSLTVKIDTAHAPTLWFYDEALTRMVLLNAIYNALRHARTTITLFAAQHGTNLLFEIRDDGPGFPPDMIDQPARMSALSREGTGLGLHLASQVAVLHHNHDQTGRIELKNADGAVFCLLLPQ